MVPIGTILAKSWPSTLSMSSRPSHAVRPVTDCCCHGSGKWLLFEFCVKEKLRLPSGPSHEINTDTRLLLCACANGMLSMFRCSLYQQAAEWQSRSPITDSMKNKPGMIFLLAFVLILVAFGTWQLFAGNLEAAFSTFPFLLIMYLFVLKMRR